MSLKQGAFAALPFLYGSGLDATVRKANAAELGLQTTNIVMHGNGATDVYDLFASAEPSVHALGDVIDRVQLTPVAIQEAMAQRE